MAEGLFSDDNNIELNNIILFGTPAYGDEEYVKTFNEDAQKLGANIWTVEVHGDPMPTVLTPDASSYFTRYDYGTVGNKAYITAEGDVTVNPDKDTLDNLRSKPSPDGMHTSDNYNKTLNTTITPDSQPAEQPVTPEISAQPTSVLQI